MRGAWQRSLPFGLALYPGADAAKTDRLRSAQRPFRNRDRTIDPRPHQGVDPRWLQRARHRKCVLGKPYSQPECERRAPRFLKRLKTNVRPPPGTERTAARELRLQRRESRLGEAADGKISAGPAGLGGDRDHVAGAGTERRLGFGSSDPRHRRSARHALHPRARGRDLLHHVPAAAGGQEGAHSGLRHHAVPAARRRRTDRDVPAPHPPRSVPVVEGRRFQLGRGRMPRRLRQRADGADLERYLRGSHQGKFWQAAGWFCVGYATEARTTERPTILRPDRRTDHAEEWRRRQYFGSPKEPVLADAESKKPGEAANFDERPSPKPPADDATRKDPP